ncbi:16S rRNA (guanine(527)-N(7))-methyltransferase RsmG [Brevibacillus massiliensis]|jgi:16S rRNA (guanine527-N7)-methyltransferase|uniref:16S rRNA (guanine(527)-N(7))-methyltransferase RsmG n=1 Tax=Brevibacillus massiliensis TaxID=1118054 RepID=UPI0002E859D9|nr:16S rRNA (guanine(527)-N(7))-methyltransferase RsmG [Brevibacillus massiliensis]
MGKEQFAERLSENGIVLTAEQLAQFDLYYRLLVEWNEKMNLTAITEENAVYTKHFYDSVSAAFSFPFAEINTVVDIGAGAGFPSIPLKICFPHLQVTIVDSLQKRISFLENLSRELGLTHVQPLHGRAEDFGQDKAFRESYDLATARAVARLNVLAEFCLPFVKVGGHFIAMKGPDISFELQEAKKAIKALGGKTKKVETLHLPDEAGERNIIVIDKIDPTPKTYPRKAGTPVKKPIL